VLAQTGGHNHESAAPGFVMFEAWAFLLPRAQDLPRHFSTGHRRDEVHSSQPNRSRECYTCTVPNRLHRYYGSGYSHFITTSCYRRLPLLATPWSRDLFLTVLESVRRRYHFVVVGYVIMPEHVHLLITEPGRGDPSAVMKALKQGFARRLHRTNHSHPVSLMQAPVEFARIWQPRFYDFVVFSDKKRVEKLRYMHRNPVKRGLVLESQQWAWSSFRYYAYGELGPVVVNEPQRAELKVRKIS
jgi:putative transposase